MQDKQANYSPGKYAGIINSGMTIQSRWKPIAQMMLSITINNYLDPRTNSWVKITPFDKKIYLDLEDYNESDRASYSLKKLKEAGFNGDFDNPEFSRGKDDSLVIVECRGYTDKVTGLPKTAWDLWLKDSVEKATEDQMARLRQIWKSRQNTESTEVDTGDDNIPF